MDRRRQPILAVPQGGKSNIAASLQDILHRTAKEQIQCKEFLLIRTGSMYAQYCRQSWASLLGGVRCSVRVGANGSSSCSDADQDEKLAANHGKSIFQVLEPCTPILVG